MLRQKLGGSYESHDTAAGSGSSSSSNEASSSSGSGSGSGGGERPLAASHQRRTHNHPGSQVHSPRRTQSVRVNPIVRLQNENGHPVQHVQQEEQISATQSQSVPKNSNTTSPINIPR